MRQADLHMRDWTSEASHVVKPLDFGGWERGPDPLGSPRTLVLPGGRHALVRRKTVGCAASFCGRERCSQA